jgi:hypothetical protein
MKQYNTPGRFNDRSMALMGIPDLPEGAFGGDLPPLQRTALVRAMGIRPQGGGAKAVLGVVAAVAIPFVAPAIVGAIASSTAIAAAMPAVTAALSTTAGAVVGSAIVGAGLGAVTAAVTGQNVGRSALMGAIGGGIGGYMQAGTITAQGANVGTGSTPLTASGTSVATTPTANAVVTNVGSGTGYWSPELGQFVDPMTGNTIAAQNIAYGGQVNSALASQLSSGAATAQDVANAINGGIGAASPGVSTLAVNTPAAIGGNTAALGSTTYYNPNLSPTTVGGAGSSYTDAANAGTSYAAQTSPTYAQAGLQATPAMEQAAANAAVQSGSMVNVPGTGGAATQTVASTSPAAQAAAAAKAAVPTTLSEALKAKFTDPRNQADMLLRAAGQLAGSAIAGDGLSDEEKQLLQQQTAELKQLRETNQELFQQRLQEAQNIIGESKYFDPAYFGMQAERSVRTQGARAKREALSKYGSSRAGLRAAEERRFDLGIATGSQTAYLQGADAAQRNKVNTAVTGANLLPTSGPSAGLQFGSYVGGLYDAAERRRRQAAGDIGDLFGTFTGTRA